MVTVETSVAATSRAAASARLHASVLGFIVVLVPEPGSRVTGSIVLRGPPDRSGYTAACQEDLDTTEEEPLRLLCNLLLTKVPGN